MSLAAYVDLDVAAATPHIADSQEYLLVHRYDRDREVPDGRIHQEDFCQALGLVPRVKYEREGGPTTADCAELIRRHVSAPARDITAFLDALLFNLVIGNHDGHSKNYSLLLDGPGSIRLAPLYDLLSTIVFANSDRKLAMRYGGENRPPYLRRRHLDRLAMDLGVKPALVRRRAIAMRERTEAAVDHARRSLPDEFQDRPMLDRIFEVIVERNEALTKRANEAGETVSQPSSETAEGLIGEDGGSADAVSEGLKGLNEAFDLVGDLFHKATGDLLTLEETGQMENVAARVERLASELDAPALKIKAFGREIYDAVVDFDVLVERVLGPLGEKEDLDSAEAEFVAQISDLATVNEEVRDDVEEIYSTISQIEQTSPIFRAPVRRMRAGLRDTLDARTIIFGWGQRVKALGLASKNGIE